MFSAVDYLDLAHTRHGVLFGADQPVWSALQNLASYLEFRLKPEIRSPLPPGAHVTHDVFIDEDCEIDPGVVIRGPAWIGRNCHLRAGCYIRENVIIGNGCVVGNSCEIKHSILFDDCQVPHFNYVGDSILGHAAHLGAGAILSNFRLDQRAIDVRLPDGKLQATGMRKFGAIIGDRCQIGCNSVINPGTLLGPDSVVHPLTAVQGTHPHHSTIKPTRA
jgi:NDP-sugar pyrophosphorylase family protein